MPVKIYGDSQSDNCYKVKLLCVLFDIKYKRIHIDVVAENLESNNIFIEKSEWQDIATLTH